MIPSAKKLLMCGVGYDKDAQALVARMTVRPSADRQKLISKTITALKRAGVWPKLDYFYAVAAHTAQAASLNWRSSSFTLLQSGPNGYLADRYYVQPNRAEGEGLTTQFRPATNGVNWTQNSAHIAAFGRTDGTLTGVGGRDVGGTSLGVNAFTINGVSGTPSGASVTGPFLQVAALQNAQAEFSYKKPGLAPTSFGATDGSGIRARPPRAIYLGTLNGGDQGEGAENRFIPDGGTIMAASGGSYLTVAEIAAFGSAVETYLQGVGAIT